MKLWEGFFADFGVEIKVLRDIQHHDHRLGVEFWSALKSLGHAKAQEEVVFPRRQETNTVLIKIFVRI